MTDSSLQDRLREHAKAFDGLLSLIPAKMYYGEDHSDQWNRKKQTKAEAKAARMSKLDPDSDLNRNAKEIMDERAKNKRKLQELEEADNADPDIVKHHNETLNGDGNAEEEDKADEGESADGIAKEAPGEGMKRKVPAPNKKQKVDGKFEGDEPLDSLASVFDADPTNMTQDQLMKMAKLNAKKAERKAKQERQAEKRAAKKAAKEAATAEKAEKKSKKKEEAQKEVVGGAGPAADKKKEDKQQTTADGKSSQATKQQQQKAKANAKAKKADTTSRSDPDRDEDYETVSGESDAEEDDAAAESSKVPTPKPEAPKLGDKPTDSAASSPRSASGSPVFDTSSPSDAAAVAAATSTSGQTASASIDPASTTTSISSTVPPSEKPKHIKIPQDTSALKARLAARIAELQAARKAIGPDGKPIRTRQELIESQRARQAQRKAHKKEQRQKAKQEEERQRDEALASNSPSIMSPALDHLLADDNEGGGQEEPADYSFGRVVFNDDTKLSRDLTHALNSHKKKGPSDPKTALLRLQNQKKKHAALDKDKQEDIAEKEAWLAARRRAEGERIKNDESMLKKTIKRKDKQKKRSEKEWKERSEGVQRAGWEKQKKREENLKKRRDDKKLGKAGKAAVKGVKVGKKKGGAVAGGGGKKGGRPGFEGSFGGMGGKKKK